MVVVDQKLTELDRPLTYQCYRFHRGFDSSKDNKFDVLILGAGSVGETLIAKVYETQCQQVDSKPEGETGR
jgi:hypothetical protein